MASISGEQMIVGLDIGTSKVVAIVGVAGANGKLEIVGTGLYPSSGIKKGWWSTSSRRCTPSSAPSRRWS